MRTFFLLVLLSSSAAAQPAASEPSVVAKTPESPRTVTLTVSPLHAIALPMAELMAEFRPVPRLGIALIGGLGRVEANGITATATEAGAQASYYVFRDFVGMHLGGEVLYLHLGDIEQDMTVTAEGLSVGAFIGWKYVHASGFTFLAQGGASVIAARAESMNSSAEQQKVYPLLNLNLGWSL